MRCHDVALTLIRCQFYVMCPLGRLAFRGSNLVVFIYPSLLNWGQHFKERICSSRVKPFLKGFIIKGTKVVPLRKNDGKKINLCKSDGKKINILLTYHLVKFEQLGPAV